MPAFRKANRFPRGDPSKTRKGGRYDGRHARDRRIAAARHRPSDPCSRCGKALGPMGPWLHYDHTDDGEGYLGFAHAACNRKAGAQAGNRAQRAARHHTQPRARTRWQSRTW